MKKVCLLGGTGALGVYLTQELVKMGYKVDVVSMDEITSVVKNLRYIKHDAKDLVFLQELIKNEYDSIVDFMVYPTIEEFSNYYPLFLENTSHYVYLSTYRVYGDAKDRVTEETPRLFDLELPDSFVKDREYSIYKAQGEDALRASGKNNWTILRPTITFSKRRFQLVTLEAPFIIHRMYEGKPIILPRECLNIQATLSWGGDFGKMVSRLLFNPQAYGEAFTVGTAEYHTWKEMAEMYARIGGLKYVAVETEDFLDLIDGNVYSRQQLLYDRCFNRALDNSKILNTTGMKQSELMPTEKGLRLELSQLDKNIIPYYKPLYEKWDAFLNK